MEGNLTWYCSRYISFALYSWNKLNEQCRYRQHVQNLTEDVEELKLNENATWIKHDAMHTCTDTYPFKQKNLTPHLPDYFYHWGSIFCCKTSTKISNVELVMVWKTKSPSNRFLRIYKELNLLLLAQLLIYLQRCICIIYQHRKLLYVTVKELHSPVLISEMYLYLPSDIIFSNDLLLESFLLSLKHYWINEISF